MEQKTKKWGVLAAAVLLSLGSAAWPQGAQAADAATIGSGYLASIDSSSGQVVFNPGSAQVYDATGTAIGNSSLGYGSYATAVGNTAQVGQYDFDQSGITGTVVYGTAIGSFSKAFANNATAVGAAANSYGVGATSLGYGAFCGVYDAEKKMVTANADYTTAVGGATQAGAEGATAVGYNAVAKGKESIAIGHLSEFTDTTTKETRYLSMATGEGSITLMGTSTGESAVSIGHAAYAVGDDSVALGSEAQVADKDGSAIGSGAISYSKGASALGAESKANGVESTAIGYYTTANGLDATAVGSGAVAYNTGSLALGAYAKTGYYTYNEETKTWNLVENVGGQYATAMGYSANAVGNYSVAIGYGAMAGYSEGDADTTAGSATAVGLGAGALGDTSTALGAGAHVQSGAHASMAVGTNTFVLQDKTYSGAIGYEAQALESGAFAIGYQAVANKAQATEDAKTGAATQKDGVTVSTVSFGHQATDHYYAYNEGELKYEDAGAYGDTVLSRLTNIAVGKADTDAVNFSQIKITAPTTGTTYLTSTLNTDGSINEKGTVGANFLALDTALTGLDTRVTTLETGVQKIQTTIGNVKLNTQSVEFDFTDKKEDTQTISYTDGNGKAGTFNITIKGISSGGSGEGGTTYTAGDGIEISEGDKPTISVKKGNVAAGDTGFVTGGTVYDSLQSMDNRLSDDINKVGAGAAALSALRPESGFNPLDKWSFAVGYGHYKNANAGALGAFFKPNADTTLSLGGTIGNGDPMLNAGVSFKLGQRGKALPQNANNSQLVQEVNSLRKNNERLTAQNEAQQNEIAALRADNQRMQQQIAQILSRLDMSGKVSHTAR